MAGKIMVNGIEHREMCVPPCLLVCVFVVLCCWWPCCCCPFCCCCYLGFLHFWSSSFLFTNTLPLRSQFCFVQRPEQSGWRYWSQNWHVTSSHHDSTSWFYHGICIWMEADPRNDSCKSLSGYCRWNYCEGNFLTCIPVYLSSNCIW